MNCKQFLSDLSAYVDGELAAECRLPLAKHLEGCASCRAELVELERAKATLSTAPERMPEALRTNIEEMIDRETAAPEPWLAALRPWLPQTVRLAFAGAAAAAAIAIVIGIGHFKPEEPSVPIKHLLAEHVRSTRKSADIHRGILAAAPYNLARNYTEQ